MTKLVHFRALIRAKWILVLVCQLETPIEVQGAHPPADEIRLCGTWSDRTSTSSASTTITFYALTGSLEANLASTSGAVSKAGAAGEDYKVALNVTSSPSQIDFLPYTSPTSSTTRRGIYRFSRGRLELAIGSPGTARPAEFSSDRHGGQSLLTLEFQPVPDGWTHISLGTGTGVDVYEKVYIVGGSGRSINHYVTIVDLTRATIRSMVGSAFTALEGPIDAHYMSTYYNEGLDANTSTRKLKVLINGTYFTGPDLGPQTIDHGLKKDGTIWAYGTKNKAIPKRWPFLRSFSFGDGWARIDAYAAAIFSDPKVPNVIGGIGTGWPVSPLIVNGRNYVGVRDRDGDGINETVIIFITNQAKQKDGVVTLCSFGVAEDNVMMLDGGASTRMYVDGIYKVKAYNPLAQVGRAFPHMISIYMGK
jgi:uncharacterized protein (TIGR03067 family)